MRWAPQARFVQNCTVQPAGSFPFEASKLYSGTGATLGNAIVSGIPLGGAETWVLAEPDDASIDCRTAWTRTAIAVPFLADWVGLAWVVDTHFPNHLNKEEVQDEKLFRCVVDRLTTELESLPFNDFVILTGDLNVNSNREQLWSYFLDKIEPLGYRRMKTHGVDHVFVRDAGYAMASFHAFVDDAKGTFAGADYDLSDHAWIVSDIELGPRRRDAIYTTLLYP